MKTVLDLMREIDDTHDISRIMKLENFMMEMVMIPVLLLSLILNAVIYFYDPSHIQFVLRASLIHFIVGALIILLNRTGMQATGASVCISLLISLWVFFSGIIYFEFIGPSVLTFGFLMILLAIFRVQIIMLVFVCISEITLGIYLTFFYLGKSIVMNELYFVGQFTLFTFVFVFASVVFRVNRRRVENISRQVFDLTSKNTELALLNTSLTETEKSLHLQNALLVESNRIITENEKRLNYLAYFDPLTGLPNRKMITEQLFHLIRPEKNRVNPFYLVFIDLDKLKLINDTMGYRQGDLLLRTTAETLKAFIQQDDLLGRMGGDEFALIISRELTEAAASRYVEDLRKNVASPVLLGDVQVKSTASFGIALFPRDGRDEIEIIRCADTALREAKEMGGNSVRFFREAMKEWIDRRLALETRLQSAVSNREFYLNFQPQFSCGLQTIRGFEVLLRWNSEGLGAVGPDEFIPIAEKIGMMVPIGNWVLLESCRFYCRNQKDMTPGAIMSVNVSPLQIKHPDFLTVVRSIIAETGMDPAFLEFEITESLFIDDFEKVNNVIADLVNYGIQIALDDFGTGFSSLNYLRSFPFDTLKIDKSFVRDLSESPINRNLLRDMITLIHNLDMRIVAEGIETKDQLDCLESYDCDYVQGYLLGKPMSETGILSLFNSRNLDDPMQPSGK